MLAIENSKGKLLNLDMALTMYDNPYNPKNLVVEHPADFMYEVEGLTVEDLKVVRAKLNHFTSGYLLAVTTIPREFKITDQLCSAVEPTIGLGY